MKFTEFKLETAIVELLGEGGYPRAGLDDHLQISPNKLQWTTRELKYV